MQVLDEGAIHGCFDGFAQGIEDALGFPAGAQGGGGVFDDRGERAWWHDVAGLGGELVGVVGVVDGGDAAGGGGVRGH